MGFVFGSGAAGCSLHSRAMNEDEYSSGAPLPDEKQPALLAKLVSEVSEIPLDGSCYDTSGG